MFGIYLFLFAAEPICGIYLFLFGRQAAGIFFIFSFFRDPIWTLIFALGGLEVHRKSASLRVYKDPCLFRGSGKNERMKK